MKIVAIIPARGGSKGIKNKNLKPLKKKPLIYWSIKAAKESILIDDFFLSTEDKKIKNMSLKYGKQILVLKSSFVCNSTNSSLSSPMELCCALS